jgi:hypothetical protein
MEVDLGARRILWELEKEDVASKKLEEILERSKRSKKGTW